MKIIGGKLMSKKKLLVSATLLTTALLGVSKVSAQEYEDATTARVDSAITFEKDEGPVNPVDPEDPDNPIDPDNPNDIGGELMISYASNLSFGDQEKSGTSWNALADVVNNGEKTVTPFVGTKDSRGSDRNGWVLTVKQDDAFKDSENNELAGAELVFSNLFYAEQAGAPEAASGEVTVNTSPQEIAKASSAQGVGSWSVGLGKLNEDGKTNGVTLRVPSTTAKNTGTYTTTVTWELTADPVAPE